MWSRPLFLVWFFTLTILATQSHVIHKRGLLSKMFGGSRQSTQNVDADMSPRERSKFRELLKNPIVITMLSAAVGMVVQKALANKNKNINDVCENKYIKMANMAGNTQAEIQKALEILGCTGTNRKGGDNSGNNAKDKYGVSTTPGYKNNQDNENEEEEEESDNQNGDNNNNNEDTLENSLPPEKESKLKNLLSISRGEKGAKRRFIKNLFGFGKKDKTFKKGHKLPSSSYKLDKDDANSMTELEKDIEESH